MPDIGLAQPAIRTLDFLDQTGHTAFGWDAADDEWVLPLIQSKMDQGYNFWIVKPKRLGNGVTERQIRKVSQVGPTRRVMIHDEDARKLFEGGRIGMHVKARAEDDYVFERRARTAREAVENDTIAHRAPRGG